VPPTAVPGPAHLSVQHILISFAGTGTKATRTQEEAKKLADDVFAQAKGGADFDKLVQQYTDDQAPGIYNMSNIGVAADPAQQEFPRDQMVPAFGNVAFDLAVGEIGMAEFDAATSPFGWHIIKRLK
jgi:parvulin-like peptidyl-prolyl isomerase